MAAYASCVAHALCDRPSQLSTKLSVWTSLAAWLIMWCIAKLINAMATTDIGSPSGYPVQAGTARAAST